MPFHIEAIQREADPEPWEFDFDGVVYRLPSDVDVRVLAALDGNRFDEALQLLMGPDQWRKLNESKAIFGSKQLQALMQGYLGDLGIELGKPSASTGSSASTETPSKRTYSEPMG